MTEIYWIKPSARLDICRTLGLPLWTTVNGKTCIREPLTEHQAAELERLKEKQVLTIQRY